MNIESKDQQGCTHKVSMVWCTCMPQT